MNKETINTAAMNIRSLVLDALEEAGSGHPGLPLGCAELGTVIYGEILKHCPEHPDWINRDRFILSGGHGSLLLYLLLHLSGYDLPMEEIKRFRKLGSIAPGHPEHGKTPGVETTTGPLGQGFGNAVGMALAERILAYRFNTDEHEIVDHYTYVMAGDGDLMEGVSYESASIAGHLGLGKLIVFYDSNQITIDGRIDLSFSEDVAGRFQACGWQTLSGSAYDPDEIMELSEQARAEKKKPTLIIMNSLIGRGSPDYEDTHQAHGSVFSSEEIKRTKENIGTAGLPPFHILPEVMEYFSKKKVVRQNAYAEWTRTFSDWGKRNPQLLESWNVHFSDPDKLLLEYNRPEFSEGEVLATRVAGGMIAGNLMKSIPSLIGGSADLSMPNYARMDQFVPIGRNKYAGNYIHYGIREHAMGSVSNGMALHGGLRPFCGTFMAFSDYMRPAIRLAAIMQLPVIYVFSHDSVLIGADGPTHQPVEFFAALEAIPGLVVLRPGDAQETVLAWETALTRKEGPTVLALARQNSEIYAKDDPEWRASFGKGAYVVRDSEGLPDIVVIATGSEVETALKVQAELKDVKIRVVSMPSRKLFRGQGREYQEKILPKDIERVVIEAGISMGWEGFFADRIDVVSIERFGMSGDGRQVADALGVSEMQLTGRILEAVKG